MAYDQFLQQFEKRRLEIERRILTTPEARQVVARYGGPPDGQGQLYLNATPTVVTLIDFISQAPRTVDTFKQRIERAGPTKIRIHEVGRAFTCFGIAYMYRFMAKRSNSIEMAQLLSRTACLAVLPPKDLEKIDWVVRSFSHRDRYGHKDPLAPPLLLIWWLTGGESTTRAYEVKHLLDCYADFIRQALELALQNQIHLNFPW